MKKKDEKLTIQKKLDYVKTIRGIDRELAKESGEFHTWMPTNRVHKDKKKEANRKTSRNYRYRGNE